VSHLSYQIYWAWLSMAPPAQQSNSTILSVKFDLIPANVIQQFWYRYIVTLTLDHQGHLRSKVIMLIEILLKRLWHCISYCFADNVLKLDVATKPLFGPTWVILKRFSLEYRSVYQICILGQLKLTGVVTSDKSTKLRIWWKRMLLMWTIFHWAALV